MSLNLSDLDFKSRGQVFWKSCKCDNLRTMGGFWNWYLWSTKSLKGCQLFFVCSHRTWAPSSHWINHELLHIPKTAWLNLSDILDHVLEQWSAPANLQQIGRKIKESRCCNGSVSPIPSLTKMYWWDLKSTVHKQKPTNLKPLFH